MAIGPFLIDIESDRLSPEEKSLIKHPMLGGIVFFSKNIKPQKQAFKTLVAEIKDIQPDLLLLVDQEGGSIQRFSGSEYGDWPNAFSFGALYDQNPNAALNKVYDMALEMGTLLRDLEIDINLAPVLDLHSENPVIGGLKRAFHSHPSIVIELTKAFIDGMHSANVACCGKHFPGHGASQEDSHLTASQSSIDAQALTQHLAPFKELIQAHKLDCIMPAHVRYPQFDPQHSAGFSPYWIGQVLRQELDFKGIVISDCLSMLGAARDAEKELSLNERALQALNAGCDLVILCQQSRKTLTHLLNDLLDYDWKFESKSRILNLKNN